MNTFRSVDTIFLRNCIFNESLTLNPAPCAVSRTEWWVRGGGKGRNGYPPLDPRRSSSTPARPQGLRPQSRATASLRAPPSPPRKSPYKKASAAPSPAIACKTRTRSSTRPQRATEAPVDSSSSSSCLALIAFRQPVVPWPAPSRRRQVIVNYYRSFYNYYTYFSRLSEDGGNNM